MNEQRLALALKKQRLRFEAGAEREQWRRYARGLAPICKGADHVGAGLRWLRSHPQALTAAGVATGVALLVAKPRALFRWVRRGFLAWQAWRRGSAWLAEKGMSRNKGMTNHARGTQA